MGDLRRRLRRRIVAHRRDEEPADRASTPGPDPPVASCPALRRAPRGRAGTRDAGGGSALQGARVGRGRVPAAGSHTTRHRGRWRPPPPPVRSPESHAGRAAARGAVRAGAGALCHAVAAVAGDCAEGAGWQDVDPGRSGARRRRGDRGAVTRRHAPPGPSTRSASVTRDRKAARSSGTSAASKP